ncbi:MAG: Aliphatic sulfonates import ATP-binding protein SsuB [Turneriella sp.]|nr:Aliphatic sulfonates import ATP-binding protein SsuB [Turneriella sp.]
MEPKHKLVVNGVSQRFGRQEILEDISFTLETGKSVVLLGPSGSGKTTLFRICANLLEAEKGKVERYYKNLGYMFQTPRLLPWETAYANLRIVLKSRGISSKESRDKIIAMGKSLGLTEDDLEKYPYQLSGGMQSRVAMGRALIIEPDVLFLDEPFTGLDIGLKRELMQALKNELKKKTSIFMITHELSDAVELADQIILLGKKPGRILEKINIPLAVEKRTPLDINEHLQTLVVNPKISEAFELRRGFL